MKGIKINKTKRQIMCINFVIIFLTTMPFLVLDGFFAESIQFSTYDNVKRMLSQCYLEDSSTTRSLLSWLQVDQLIRVLSIVFAATLLTVGMTIQSSRVMKFFLIFSYGNLTLLIYQSIWHIEGIFIFSKMLRLTLSSPLKCASHYQPYMLVSSSLGTILIIVNIVLSFLRPK